MILANRGLLLCVFGIVGGFASGLISDKFFNHTGDRKSTPIAREPERNCNARKNNASAPARRPDLA